MKKIPIDSFVLAIVLVVILAFVFPHIASWLPIDSIASYGVSLIFFFYGLKLSLEKIVSGLSNWKLHLLVQSSTFLLFPILIILAKPMFSLLHADLMWLSFFFLAALPSTVSSSVVMVSMAKGNIPAAIFNASISGLIGVVLTPLWMSLFLKQQGGEYDLSSVYFKLLVEILLPICLGLILQRFWGRYAQKYAKQLSLFDKAIILLIIYKSFVVSFQEKVFESVSVMQLVVVFVLILCLFYTVFYFVGFIAKRLKFTDEDIIVAQYCGTKKSLVHGTVFSKVLFPASSPHGLILLPLMIFHAMQIFVISLMVAKKGKEN
ncbi:MAG TPA: bile acid:sodium symporter family protein [Taishania sp.]|nr:bile acid:sodium symporter family protein [Taishania sp.]